MNGSYPGHQGQGASNGIGWEHRRLTSQSVTHCCNIEICQAQVESGTLEEAIEVFPNIT